MYKLQVRPDKNGWASRRDRVKMALRCLQGNSVVFNTRFYVTNNLEKPVRITPINPTGHLYVQSCLFANDPNEPPKVIRVEFGDY